MTEPVDQRLSANHAAGRPGSVSVDLDALRTLAEQATPGPWFSIGLPWNPGPPFIKSSFDPHGGVLIADFAACGEDIDDRTTESVEADASFIAACSPEVVLALVEAVQAAIENAEVYSITFQLRDALAPFVRASTEANT